MASDPPLPAGGWGLTLPDPNFQLGGVQFLDIWLEVAVETIHYNRLEHHSRCSGIQAQRLHECCKDLGVQTRSDPWKVKTNLPLCNGEGRPHPLILCACLGQWIFLFFILSKNSSSFSISFSTVDLQSVLAKREKNVSIIVLVLLDYS